MACQDRPCPLDGPEGRPTEARTGPTPMPDEQPNPGPTVRIASARVGPSGKTLFIALQDVDGAATALRSIAAHPSIRVSGGAPIALSGPIWGTSSPYVLYPVAGVILGFLRRLQNLGIARFDHDRLDGPTGVGAGPGDVNRPAYLGFDMKADSATAPASSRNVDPENLARIVSVIGGALDAWSSPDGDGIKAVPVQPPMGLDPDDAPPPIPRSPRGRVPRRNVATGEAAPPRRPGARTPLVRAIPRLDAASDGLRPVRLGESPVDAICRRPGRPAPSRPGSRSTARARPWPRPGNRCRSVDRSRRSGRGRSIAPP